jgi:peptidoglycan/xylan/chitin deacetylase (PgdA/CDA1 family)
MLQKLKKFLNVAEIYTFNTSFTLGPLILISFDTESPIDSLSNNLLDGKSYGFKSRFGLQRIISVSEKYEFPFTFFCTGHALLKECKGHNLEINMLKENKRYGFRRGIYHWHPMDPGSNYVEYPEFYYGDLVEKLIKSGIDHEIGSHSFSHIPYSLVDDNTVIEDLFRSAEALRVHSQEFFSFSFPFNLAVTSFHLLSKFGIKISKGGHRMIRALILKDGVFIIRTHITDFPFSSINEYIKIINFVSAKKKILNWYLHPISLYNEHNYNLFESILAYLKRQEVKTITYKNLYDNLKSNL